jgi:hypothetical protein
MWYTMTFKGTRTLEVFLTLTYMLTKCRKIVSVRHFHQYVDIVCKQYYNESDTTLLKKDTL